MFLAGERRPWTAVECRHVAAASTHFLSFVCALPFSLVLWLERGAAREEHGVRGPGAQRLLYIILSPPLQSQMLSGSLSRTVPEEPPAGVSVTV